jgi:hypothetical protein
VTNTSRVPSGVVASNTPRVDRSQIVAVTFDPWNGAWGVSWGTSWLAEEAGDIAGITKRVPGGLVANNTKRVA